MRKILFSIIPALLLLSCAKEADAPLKEEEPAVEEQVPPSVSYHSVTLSATKAGATQTYNLGSDPRTWHSGINVVETSVALPSVSGTLYLLLSDPDYSANPLYSIACANTGVFESTTGYNKLLEL